MDVAAVNWASRVNPVQGQCSGQKHDKPLQITLCDAPLAIQKKTSHRSQLQHSIHVSDLATADSATLPETSCWGKHQACCAFQYKEQVTPAVSTVNNMVFIFSIIFLGCPGIALVAEGPDKEEKMDGRLVGWFSFPLYIFTSSYNLVSDVLVLSFPLICTH